MSQWRLPTGSWGLKGVSTRSMFSRASFASFKEAQVPSINGISSNCVICFLEVSRFTGLYVAFPTKFRPAMPRPFSFMAQGKYIISGSDRDLIPIGKFIIQSTPHVKVSGLVGCGCTHSSCSFLSGTISANGGYGYAQWFCPHELGKCCYTE